MSTQIPEVLRERALAALMTDALRRAHAWASEAAPYRAVFHEGEGRVERARAPGKRVAVLHGCTGAGKSIAATWCALFAEAHEAHFGEDVGYYHARDIASAAEWKEAVWEKFDAFAFVVIDDIGTERDASRCADVIERCFNHRRGLTIMTTNLRAADMPERYGARVSSRLRGEARAFNCPAVDMRIDAPTTPIYPRPDDAPHGRFRSHGVVGGRPRYCVCPFLSQAEGDAYRAAVKAWNDGEDERRRRYESGFLAPEQIDDVMSDLGEVLQDRKLAVVGDEQREEDEQHRRLQAQLDQRRREIAQGDDDDRPNSPEDIGGRGRPGGWTGGRPKP